MEQDYWKELEGWYHRCRDATPEELVQLLDQVRRQNTDLHRELVQMLDEEEEDSAILMSPAMILDDEATAAEFKIGARLGPFQIEEEIGSGGMGRVFRAIRVDGRFQQTVAIKMMRQRSFRPDLRERFLKEQQTMARLDHPRIARLLDGGVTSGGVEYFVMEYVEGEPIDVACDGRHLTIDERLRLFEQVARAVHAAHQQLVVHRDLKPSNILIDRDGRPKLLDFGIAKNLPRGNESEDATATRLRMMTPLYASPEQVQGGPITATTDVYALGVLLHHLLCGASPYRVNSDRLHELEHAICDQLPVLPSDSLASVEDLAQVAELRAIDASRLRRRLRGDLDIIVSKTLAKDPDDRYASAQALADDVLAVLQRRPIQAVGPSLGKRIQRVMQRYARPIGIGALLSMIAGAAYAVVHFSKVASTKTEIADNQSRHLGGVREILNQLVAQGNPWTVEGGVCDVAVLDQTERLLDQIRDLDLTTELEVRLTLCRSLRAWCRWEDAERHLKRLEQRVQEDGAGAREKAVVLCERLEWLGDTGRGAEASELALKRLPELLEQMGDDRFVHARLIRQLGRAHRWNNDYAEAAAAYKRASEVLGPPTKETAALAFALEADHASLYWDRGKMNEAAVSFQKALDLYGGYFSEEHPRLIRARLNLADTLWRLGRVDEAESLAKSSLENWKQVFGDTHEQVSHAHSVLAHVLIAQEKHDEAWPHLEEAARISEELHPEGHSDLIGAWNNIAVAHRRAGDFGKATGMYERALGMARRVLGPTHRRTGTLLSNLGALLVSMRELDRARPILEEALRVLREAYGEEHYEVANTRFWLGSLYWESGGLDDALFHHAQALDARRVVLPEGHEYTSESMYCLAMVHVRLKELDEAEELFGEAFDALSLNGPPPVIPYVKVGTLWAETLAALGRIDEADEVLLKVARRLAEATGPTGESKALLELSRKRVQQLRTSAIR